MKYLNFQTLKYTSTILFELRRENESKAWQSSHVTWDGVVDTLH
jgi:hypothetical protein